MEISVIIPALNEEKYLGRALESIYRQKFYYNYEVIIGDGGSTDRTERIAREYGAKLVVEKKRTIAAGRQKACEQAKGRVIVSTDADIRADENWLNEIWKAYDGNVATYGPIYALDGDWLQAFGTDVVFNNYMRLCNALGLTISAGSNISFLRKDFEAIGGWNTDLAAAEDLDILKRLQARGKLIMTPNAKVFVSTRRVKGWGYAKFLSYHATSALKYFTTGKSHERYERVG
jgi:glycosyltransferase involved in cell wall biosynthesis